MKTNFVVSQRGFVAVSGNIAGGRQIHQREDGTFYVLADYDPQAGGFPQDAVPARAIDAVTAQPKMWYDLGGRRLVSPPKAR